MKRQSSGARTSRFAMNGAMLRTMALLIALTAVLAGTGCAEKADGSVVELVVRNGSVVHEPVKDFDALIQASELPVLVDFWATWCPPCKASGPFIEKLAMEYEGRVVFIKVDVDQAQSIASAYGVRSIPQFFLIKNGSIVGEITGYASSIDNQFYEMIDAALG